MTATFPPDLFRASRNASRESRKRRSSRQRPSRNEGRAEQLPYQNPTLRAASEGQNQNRPLRKISEDKCPKQGTPTRKRRRPVRKQPTCSKPPTRPPPRSTCYNLRLIEIARANAGAAFDHAHELLGVKSGRAKKMTIDKENTTIVG